MTTSESTPAVTTQPTRRSGEIRYRIAGGVPLRGAVKIDGAKNAINKQLVASLLTDEPCTFWNVPRIEEVFVILEMLTALGAKHEWLAEDTLVVQAASVDSTTVDRRYAGFNRIPILMISPLLHRRGTATVPRVGGDRIGTRPINFHLEGLRTMGATIVADGDAYLATAEGLHGASVTLPYPSVGATENLIFAATLAKGTTVIQNAAVEPEIIDTILLLQKMGALISLEVDRRIVIEGVPRLRGAAHRVIPDRMEAASFAAAAIATDGYVTVEGARQVDMLSFLNNLRRLGGGFIADDAGIAFFRQSDGLRAVHVETDVHPGFMTDWQQSFVVLMTQARGVSMIHETVYEDRFRFTEILGDMGAQVQLSTACLGSKPCRFQFRDHFHSCIVTGPTQLRGIRMTSPDLRAGVACVIAGLAATGESDIGGIEQIDRGYENLADRLAELGAQIEVVGVP